MTNTIAQKQFLAIVLPSAVLMLILSFVIRFGTTEWGFPKAAILTIALVATLPLLAMIGAMWRLITQLDEFLRLIQIRSLLFGLAIVLSICSVWGYLENHLDVAPIPIFNLVPIFWFAYAVAAIVQTIKSGGEI